MKHYSGMIAAFKNKKAKEQMARGVIASFLGVFVMACSGCGGGGGAPTAAPSTSAAPAHALRPVVIGAEGDSTMAGGAPGTAPPVAQPAPAEMQRQLRAMMGNQITVENNAVAGSTTRNDLDGTAPDMVPLAKKLQTDPSQIVLANFAINDAYHKRTTDEYGADLTEWVATVRAAKKTPVLEEPNPVCWAAINLDPYVAMMRVVAQQQHVLLIEQYDYIRSLPNWQSMELDCVHPAQELYTIKGGREAQQIASLVRDLTKVE